MTSIRRTLSPVPRAVAIQNGEAHLVASPLSKSSTYTQNYPSSGGLPSSPFSSINSHSVLYRIQDVVCGIFTQRSSRHLDRTKAKGHVWKRAFFHFSICFIVGILIGLTHFVSTNFSINLGSKHQAFTFEVIPPIGNTLHFDTSRNKRPLIDRSEFKDNASLEMQHAIPFTQLVTQEQDFVNRKLLIIVTPTYTRLFQAYYLNRLAHTLRLVSPPLLWIVVEMYSQSAETADILRKTGVMYRHLVCDRNITGVKDRSLHQRNMALFHIETHRLDGIVYFADDDNMYSIELFEQMREIRRLGTWPAATLIESKNKVILDGPVCNGSQVIGWHTRERTRRQRRFFVGMSGFAFNSTILWDPKRWHRPTLELIRQLDTVKDGFQESTFIEQLVEDESQMEGIPKDCSRIMVWRLQLESSHPFYPGGWIKKKNLDVVAPLA